MDTQHSAFAISVRHSGRRSHHELLGYPKADEIAFSQVSGAVVDEAYPDLPEHGWEIADITIAVSRSFAICIGGEDSGVWVPAINVLIAGTAEALDDTKVPWMGILIEERDGFGVGVEDHLGTRLGDLDPCPVVWSAEKVSAIVNSNVGC